MKYFSIIIITNTNTIFFSNKLLNMSTSVLSVEFTTLREFLKNEPLDQITISRVLHKYWKDCGVNTEEVDCGRVMEVLRELAEESTDESRNQHLLILLDIEKVLIYYYFKINVI